MQLLEEGKEYIVQCTADNKRTGVVTLNVEKLAHWANTLNVWEWPEDMPHKPDAWDAAPCYCHPDDSQRNQVLTKYSIILPLNALIEALVGEKEVLRWHWLNNLDRTEEEFEEWWEKEGERCT